MTLVQVQLWVLFLVSTLITILALFLVSILVLVLVHTHICSVCADSQRC